MSIASKQRMSCLRTRSNHRVRLHVEQLEVRWAPAIGLNLVALHEFGHSLGLAHHNSPSSIMYRYYNANYNVDNLANDPAVVAKKDGYKQLMELFSDANINNNKTSWKDSLDANPGDGTVNVTYSFMPNNVNMDVEKPGLRNIRNSSTDDWDGVFAAALNLWATVSAGNLTFAKVDEVGNIAFNAGDNAQNDASLGDIRIGFHVFDGSLGVLAHTYYPPPNGNTASGDAHFDIDEQWLASAPSTSDGGNGGTGGNPGNGNLTFGFVVDQTPVVEAALRLGAGRSSIVFVYAPFMSVRSDAPITNYAAPTTSAASSPAFQASLLSSGLPAGDEESAAKPDDNVIPDCAALPALGNDLVYGTQPGARTALFQTAAPPLGEAALALAIDLALAFDGTEQDACRAEALVLVSDNGAAASTDVAGSTRDWLVPHSTAALAGLLMLAGGRQGIARDEQTRRQSTAPSRFFRNDTPRTN